MAEKTEQYEVVKKMKYGGKIYNPGDPIMLDGMWDDKLIPTYVQPVGKDSGKPALVAKTLAKRNEIQKATMHAGRMKITSTRAAREILSENGFTAQDVAEKYGIDRITKTTADKFLAEIQSIEV